MDGIQILAVEGRNGKPYERVVFGTFRASQGNELPVSGIRAPEGSLKGAAAGLRNDVGYWARHLQNRIRVGFNPDGSGRVSVPGAEYRIGEGEWVAAPLAIQVESASDTWPAVKILAKQLLGRMANQVFVTLAAENEPETESKTETETKTGIEF